MKIAILIFLVLPVLAFGQKRIEIVDTYELESIKFENNTTYLLKAGEVYTLSKNIQILDKSDIKISSFGIGELPLINLAEGVEGDVVYIRACRNITIENLNLIGNFDDNVVHISGHFVSTANPTNNITINNCELSQGFNGIRSLPYQTKCDTINVINCKIHHINDDGIFIVDCNEVTIDSCHIWHVNLAWNTGGVNSGDCVHLVNECNNWSVKHNILDRRLTSNKFCFIYGSTAYMPTHGELIGNTFYPPKDTVGSTGSSIYISLSDSVKIERNKFYSDGYQWGGEPGSIAHIECNRAEFSRNYIEGLTYCRFTPEVKKINLSNNILIDSKSTVFYFENECVASDNTFYNLRGWAYSGGRNQKAMFKDTNTVYIEGYPNNIDSLLRD